MILYYTDVNMVSDDEEWGNEFEYEIGYDEELDALAEFIYEDHFENKFSIKGCELSDNEKVSVIDGIKSFLYEYCDNDKFLEDLEYVYEDSLHNHFERKAFDSYRFD